MRMHVCFCHETSQHISYEKKRLLLKINIKKYRTGNHKKDSQRNWQHRVHKDEEKQNKKLFLCIFNELIDMKFRILFSLILILTQFIESRVNMNLI